MTKTIQLIQPETLYGGYLSQLDLRVSKRFTVGRIHLRGDANVYNAFNSDWVSAFAVLSQSHVACPPEIARRTTKASGGIGKCPPSSYNCCPAPIRFAKPGLAFCSCTAIGTRSRRAAR